MKQITEKDGIHKEWYNKAKKQTLESLPAFLQELSAEYEHDYGTICHAIASAALAVAWAMDKTPQGGITGFQGSCVMWEFVRAWMQYEGPLRLIQYHEMLSPHYDYKFNSITEDTWRWLQEQAAKNLAEIGLVHPVVKARWESIVSGVVPLGLVIEATKGRSQSR